MTKKILWIVVSCLMVLSMVIASCESTETTGGTITEENQGETVTAGGTTTTEKPDTGPVASTPVNPDKPKYGGKLVYLAGSDITTWNPGASPCNAAAQGGFAIEQILGIQFDKGLAGTGETNYIGGVSDYRYLGGNICETWETPAVGVWVLNIRQGIYWYYHPDQAASKLVGGRELTAEDVAYSIEYMRDTPLSSTLCSEPTLIQNTTVERTGPYQITVRTPVAPATGYLWIMGGGGVQYVWPKEFLQTYGKSNNWFDVVGSGPYMLDDYVTSSAAKYIRNNNYWDINPCGPGKGDKLPYIESINYQIIPDGSTRLAALRTGKADWSSIDLLSTEDFGTISKSNPEIKYVQTISAPLQVSGRVDLPGPFSELQVRRALMMAIDRETIIKDLYNGQAEILDSPARKWYKTIYTPLEEQSAETQEMYQYHPDTARQLLADAGYPDGFEVKLVMQNTPGNEAAASILKEYWADIGVTINITPLEASTFIGLWVGHKSEDWILNGFAGGDGSLFVRYSMGYFRGPNIFNLSHVNDPPGTDPIIEKAFQDQCKYVMVDYPQTDAVTKEAYKYAVSQAFNIPMPAPWVYRIWQPWLKNYYGDGDVKFWLRWAWIDEDLKASLK